MKLDFDPVFIPYAAAAVGRLRYLHPACTFTLEGTSISIGGVDDDAFGAIQRDSQFQLYREKIYQEGLPMRTLMYQTLLS